MRITKPVRRMIAAVVTIIMVTTLTVNAFAIDYNSAGCDPGCPVCTEASRASSRVSVKSKNYDAVPASISFSDVPETHAFHEAILWCAEQGIVNGYSGGVFLPANTVSRSNFTVMLSRAFYASDVAANSSYASQGTFMPNYMAMLNNGILNGTPFNTVTALQNVQTMNRGINRYEMAQLMTNIMNAKGFAASSSEKNAVASKIPDLNDAPSYYQDAVKNVYALGIITGYADGSFNGAGIMNRGQAAVVIYRIMQKSGNGGGSTTPDPEAPVDPGTGEIACACVTLNGECKCCNTTGDTGNSGNTGTTRPETPETPSQPTALTLRDGSAVTEANVLKIINEVKQVYPSGSVWNDSYNTGKGLRDNYAEIGGRTLGSASQAVTQVGNNHYVSMTRACGGFAGTVSDAIFGGNGNGGENFPIRKLDSVADVRPGDIIVQLDANGSTDHVFTAGSNVKSSKVVGGVTAYAIAQNHGNMNNGVILYTETGYIFDDVYRDTYFVAYTRYPA